MASSFWHGATAFSAARFDEIFRRYKSAPTTVDREFSALWVGTSRTIHTTVQPAEHHRRTRLQCSQRILTSSVAPSLCPIR